MAEPLSREEREALRTIAADWHHDGDEWLRIDGRRILAVLNDLEASEERADALRTEVERVLNMGGTVQPGTRILIDALAADDAKRGETPVPDETV